MADDGDGPPWNWSCVAGLGVLCLFIVLLCAVCGHYWVTPR